MTVPDSPLASPTARKFPPGASSSCSGSPFALPWGILGWVSSQREPERPRTSISRSRGIELCREPDLRRVPSG